MVDVSSVTRLVGAIGLLRRSTLVDLRPRGEASDKLYPIQDLSSC